MVWVRGFDIPLWYASRRGLNSFLTLRLLKRSCLGLLSNTPFLLHLAAVVTELLGVLGQMEILATTKDVVFSTQNVVVCVCDERSHPNQSNVSGSRARTAGFTKLCPSGAGVARICIDCLDSQSHGVIPSVLTSS